jgi:hypothetical protein
VASLRIEPVAVTAVLASPATLDTLAPSAGRLLRTAPREALLLGRVDLGVADALVEDVTDGWVAFVLAGEDARDVFARLTELPPPTDWLQGDVAKTPAKVIVDGDTITILLPANLAAHVEERIRADARELLA